MWGEYNVFGKVNHKKSEFGVSYYMGPRDFYGMYRDNEEEFHLADGTTLHRIEEGEPGHGSMFMNNLSMNYNLQQTENSLFSATFRLRSNSQPHWNYQGVLTNIADSDDKVDMIDRTKESWSRPSLDLYYQQGLKNKQLLVFNVVGPAPVHGADGGLRLRPHAADCPEIVPALEGQARRAHAPDVEKPRIQISDSS